MFPKISPIIPVRRHDLFESAEWVYELKHDGFRALAYLNGSRCRLISRRGNEMKRFPDLSNSIARELKVAEAVLDGEIVALDSDGLPALYDLMKRRCQPVYYVFDIILLNGRDLRELSLLERKKILRSVIPRKSTWIGCVSYVDQDALKLFALVKKNDLEGLVAKRKDGKYKPAQTLLYKILNPAYTQKSGRKEFSKNNKGHPIRPAKSASEKLPRKVLGPSLAHQVEGRYLWGGALLNVCFIKETALEVPLLRHALLPITVYTIRRCSSFVFVAILVI